MPLLDVEVGVVGDQPRRAAELRHHRVAGVDAQAALDAAEIGAVADIDAGRADVHALQAVDAVAGRRALRAQLLGLLGGAARLAAVVAVGDVERVFVGQRRLDARPRAHIETDLLAHVAGQRIGREGEDADPGIGDEGRVAAGQILHQRRRVGEIQHPGAAGPPRHHQPGEMLGRLVAEPCRRSMAARRCACARGGRLRKSARWRRTGRSTPSAGRDSRTRPGRRRRSSGTGRSPPRISRPVR